MPNSTRPPRLFAGMSRPQIGIDRLPARRSDSDTARESMNCKSCRKRKIKCNRLRPTCEACTIFQCPCVYDATPKKRGPKPDVLEALLKRMDGLERRLQDDKKPHTQEDCTEELKNEDTGANGTEAETPSMETSTHAMTYFPSNEASAPSVIDFPDVLLDTYFSRVHSKPYRVLDETDVRERHRLNQLSPPLLLAIYAVAARYVNNPGGYNTAVKSSEDFAQRARSALDVDEPSIEGLQTCLLLTLAFLGLGKGRKAYMLLSHAVAQAFALDLPRELPPTTNASPSEREIRRRLFWACYLMDRFTACGSKRPSLIADESISLRLPSWIPHRATAPIEGELFSVGPNIHYTTDSRKKAEDASSLLIDVVRILGITNRYLAAGGVKGDSHFPWHGQSHLSKILQELEFWAASTHDTFVSLDTLFGHPESTILILSKLVFHLCHCLVLRPFLPLDLAELRGTDQHQSYQISSTNLGFLHANAIAELVDYGKATSMIEWPAFVGYCIGTAGTIHIHGVHYKGQDGEAFAPSADFLAREMQQLGWLRLIWASVQNQRETLQILYACHAELVRSLATNPIRYSPVFLLEDFFDRYPGQSFDGSHMPFVDIVVESEHESQAVYDRENLNRFRHASLDSSMIASSSTQQYFQPPQPVFQISAPQRHSSASSIPPTRTYHTHEASFQGSAAQVPPLPALASDLSSFPLSPSFAFSPLPSNLDPTFNGGNMHPGPSETPMPTYATFPFDQQAYSRPGNMSTGSAQTPGAHSQGGASSHTTGDGEKDPFLSLLEHLTENEYSQGGPSDLDFFLNPGFGTTADEDMMGTA